MYPRQDGLLDGSQHIVYSLSLQTDTSRQEDTQQAATHQTSDEDSAAVESCPFLNGMLQ